MKKIQLICLTTIFIFSIVSCGEDSSEEVLPVLSASDFVGSIDENPTSNQIIGTIAASTNQGSLSYRISSQTLGNAISIGASSGEIVVNDPEMFDYENANLLEAVVEVSGGALKKNVNVVITIGDIDEGIYTGNLSLGSQEELEAFSEMNYHTLDGDLSIMDANGMEITSLEKLNSLTKITGVLTIESTLNILDLFGLEGLTEVGGIRITNTELLDINALSNLIVCNGPITISNNLSLEFYCGLQPLFKNGSFSDTFTCTDNFLDVTVDEVIAANCN